MKLQTTFLSAWIMCTGAALAQCSDCYDLELAKKDPLAVHSLHLSNQGLEQIPPEIAQMKNLETLDLSFNRIEAIDSFLDHNTKLRRLDLSHNPGFSALVLSETFQQAVPLEQLDLSYCEISLIGSGFFGLKSLRELNLEQNRLRILPPGLSELDLRKLDLSDNNLVPVYHAFSDYWSLGWLDVSNNDSLELVSVLHNLEYKDSLHFLRFSPQNVDKQMARSLELTGIEALVFKDTDIGEIHGILRKNKQLKTISFENCALAQPSKAYRVLSGIDQLEELDFYETPVYKETAAMKQLDKLTISDAEVADAETLPLDHLSVLSWSDSKRNLGTTLEGLKTQNLELEANPQSIKVTNAMIENKLEPFAALEASVKQINPRTDNLLQFEDTECKIEKNTFLDQNGEIYTGTVDIAIREYTDPLLNALAATPMTAQSSRGNEIFASNGMIEFRATDTEGNELQIDPEKPVQITLRDVRPQNRGALYQYDTVQRTWNTIGTPTRNNYDSLFRVALDSLNELDASAFVTRVGIQPRYDIFVKRHRHDPYEISFKNYRNRLRMPKWKSSGSILYYRDNRLSATKICGNTWLMDSVSTNALDSIFRDMRKKQHKLVTTGNGYYFTPRLIRNLAIAPDFERDNFRLTFDYCGKSYDLPVYLKNARSPRATIARQKKFYRRYSHERNREVRLARQMEKELKRMEDRMAEKIRQQRAAAIAWMQTNPINKIAGMNVTPLTGKELLSFGLRSNGLFNCDYFYANRPNLLVDLPDTLRTGEGDLVPVPRDVRLVVSLDNVYFQAFSDKVPVLFEKGCIVFFSLGENQIAVVDQWKQKGTKYTYRVRRIDIQGMSAPNVRDAILSL